MSDSENYADKLATVDSRKQMLVGEWPVPGERWQFPAGANWDRISYGPAMEITDQAKADAYFEALVAHLMSKRPQNPSGRSRPEAEDLARRNIWAYAGSYTGFAYPDEVRKRVRRLFNIDGSVQERQPRCLDKQEKP